MLCALCLDLAHHRRKILVIIRVDVSPSIWEAHQGYCLEVHPHHRRMDAVVVIVANQAIPQSSALFYFLGKNVHYHPPP